MSGGDLADELAAADAEQQTARQYAAGFGDTGKLEALHTAFPNLGAATLPLAAAGVGPDHPVAQRAATAKAQRDSQTLSAGETHSGGWLSKFGWHGSVSKAVEGGLKDVVRYGSAGAEFPLQLNLAVVRDAAGSLGIGDGSGFDVAHDPLNPLKQTTVGAGVAEAADRGRLVDMLMGKGDEELAGDGWFISKDSITGKRQAREAAEASTIDGHAFTIGRGLATATPFEPGSFGYKVISGSVDLAANIALDPATYFGGKAAEGQRLRGVLDRGDLVEVNLPIGLKHAQARVDRLHAQMASMEGETPAGFDKELDDATNLRDSLLEKSRGGGEGHAAVQTAERTGLVDGLRKTVLPEHAAQWLLSETGDKVVRHYADATDFETLRRATNKKLPTQVLLDLLDAKDTATVRNVLADAIQHGQVRDVLKFSPDRVPPARLLGMMPGSRIDLENTDDAVEQLDRFQRNVRLPADVVSRNNELLARAHTNGEKFQVVEHVMNTIEQGLVHTGVDVGDARQVTKMFRDSREDLRRYFVDEVGDNAAIPGVQIGADGRPLPSPHLLSELVDRYIPLPDARELKRATRTYKAVKKVEGHILYKGPRVAADFLTSTVFKPFALALRPAWTVRVVGEEQVRMAAAGKDSLVHHPLSAISWILGEHPGKLSKLITPRGGVDALGQKWADEAALPDAVTEWAQALNHGTAGWTDRTRILLRHFTTYTRGDKDYADAWHGEITKLASDPIAREVLRHGAATAKSKFWNGNLQKVRAEIDAGMPNVDLSVRENADAYVDSVIKRIQTKAQGNSDILDAIRTGRMRGHMLTDGFNGNPKVRKMLQELADAGAGPAKVAGRLTARADKDTAGAAFEMYDKAVEHLFHALGSVPTNKLSRSPMFRQSYWQRIEETLPLLTKPERVRALRAAKEAGMPDKVLKRMRATIDRQQHAGDLMLEDADTVAKHYALHETRDLLYSLHEKSQAADALRVLFPFGEAWREVVTRWSRLGLDPRTMNPLVPYRAQQGFQAAESAGIFYNDPATGQEMFALPGSEWITKKLTGVPMKLEAPVSGLNMFGQVIPGVGPVVAMLASKVIPDSPSFDHIRSAFLPFGNPDYSGGFTESMLPAYLKKVMATIGLGGAQQQRALASTSADTMAYLYSTGDYDLSKPEDQQRLLDDAKGKSKELYLIRALAQSSAPSSPRGVFAAEDKDGRLHSLYLLKDDYRKMLDANPQTATSRFLAKYGKFAFLVTVGKTTDAGSNPVTKTVDVLARSHPDQAERFPLTIGLFADPSSTYSFTEEDRQIQSGTRQAVSLRDITRTANQRVAAAIYAQAKTHTDDPTALRDLRTRLGDEYPGYTGQPADLGKTGELIQELRKAAKDPVLSGTDAGAGLNEYLGYREQALTAAQAAGYSGFEQAAGTASLRDWLYDTGNKIAARHPGFDEMWQRVFQRELPGEDQK